MNKVEMSLDEIIKSAKTQAKGGKPKGTKAKPNSKVSPIKGGGGVTKKRSIGQKSKKVQGARKVKAGQVKVQVGKAKGKAGRRIGGQRKKVAAANNINTNTTAIKKVVQKLVKKALLKTRVGRVAAARTPTKGARRRQQPLGVEGRGVVRGRIVKRNVLLQPHPRIVAIPALPQAQLMRTPIAYQMVDAIPRRNSNRGRQARQIYAAPPPPTSQYIGGGAGGRRNIRAQIAAMKRQQQPQTVYVQRAVQQPQYIVQQPRQRERVITYQRPQQQQRQQQQQQGSARRQGQPRNRRQQQRRVVKGGTDFYDPPNFLQRI